VRAIGKNWADPTDEARWCADDDGAMDGDESMLTMLGCTRRSEILRNGLTARCEQTHADTAKLLVGKWMRAVKYNPVWLLRLLDVISHEKLAEEVSAILLDAASPHPDAVDQFFDDPSQVADYRAGVSSGVPSVEATHHCSALLLRAACAEARRSVACTDSQRDNRLQKLLPDLPSLCQAAATHLKSAIATAMSDPETAERNEFTVRQLLRTGGEAAHLLQEESGRRQFAGLLEAIVASAETPEELVEGAVRAMSDVQFTEADFVRRVGDVLHEISKMSNEEDADVSKFFQLRTLSILSVVLEVTKMSISRDPLLSGFIELVVPTIASDDRIIKEAGVGCIGKFCLSDRAVATRYGPRLLEIVDSEHEVIEIRAQAALSLSDLAMMDGEVMLPRTVGEGEERREVDFGAVLSALLQEKNDRIGLAVVSAEICAKLLLARRIQNPEFVARLLLVFFDPVFLEACGDEGDQMDVTDIGSPTRLHQLLTLFFPAYGASKENGTVLLGVVRPLLGIYQKELTQKEVSPESTPVAKKGRSRSRAKPKEAVLPVAFSKIVGYVVVALQMGQSAAATAAATKGRGEGGCAELQHPAVSVSLDVLDFLVEEGRGNHAGHLKDLCKVVNLGIRALTAMSSDDTAAVRFARDVTDRVEGLGDDATGMRLSVRSLAAFLDSVKDTEKDNEPMEGVVGLDDVSGNSPSKELLTGLSQGGGANLPTIVPPVAVVNE